MLDFKARRDSSSKQRIYCRKEALRAPHLLDVEVMPVLRRLTGQGSSQLNAPTWRLRI